MMVPSTTAADATARRFRCDAVADADNKGILHHLHMLHRGTKHHRPVSGPLGTSFDGSASVVFIVLDPCRFANQERPACVIGVAKWRTTRTHEAGTFIGSQGLAALDRKSTRLNSSHSGESRMPSSA